jgi:hypothetical protein
LEQLECQAAVLPFADVAEYLQDALGQRMSGPDQACWRASLGLAMQVSLLGMVF